MRNTALLAIVGATLAVTACSDVTGPSNVDGPQFSHILGGCRAKDSLVPWTPIGTGADVNANGQVCLKKEILRIGAEPTYYDDIFHIKERL